MRCDHAAEFVSALCDGETIPSAAAEHIGSCEGCQQRLREYIEMGVELRRLASIEVAMPVPEWKPEPRTIARYWRKGWETMRIPRLAFALLVAAIVVLGSSLAMIKAGARSEGNVALLTLDFGTGKPSGCVLAINDKRADSCGGIRAVGKMQMGYRIDLQSHDGNRLQLAIRARTHMPEDRFSIPGDLEAAPQQQVWFEPGETTRIEIGQGITMSLTGQWTDHVPSFVAQGDSHDLDPGPDELRMVGPLLLQGKTVVGDMSGGIATVDKPNMAVDVYLPPVGRFLISLTAAQGAVAAKVDMNRISFTMDGSDYVFVTGAPVTRGEKVWVLRDANFKPGDEIKGGYIGARDLVQAGFIPLTEKSTNP
jgi:hypothetical protein